MLTNFDCWVGHTNFNLSKKIASELEKIEGVELLRICSRYRFFIGIGKMFDFKAVRKNLEKSKNFNSVSNIASKKIASYFNIKKVDVLNNVIPEIFYKKFKVITSCFLTFIF